MPEVDLAAALHAQRHAAGGPDAITPESINASPGHGVTYSGHADALTSPGTYRVSASALIPDNGYPEGLTAGYVTVQSGLNVSYVFQTLVTSSGNNYDGFYVRAREAGTWRPWTKYVPDDDPRLRDTGWREVGYTFLSENAYPTVNYCRLRRIGPTVHVAIHFSYEPSAYSYVASGVPVGFRPDFSAFSTPVGGYSNTPDTIGIFGINSSGTTFLRMNSSSGSATTGYFNASWTTSNSWPSTLPGTPA